MTLTFYHVPMSTSNSTATVLDELEYNNPAAPLCKRVELSIKAGDTKTPEYLRDVNPNGRVPAIVQDGVAIWESAAVNMYLGETFGVDLGLYPAAGLRRGEAMKWMVWANASFAVSVGRLAEAMPAGTPGAVEHGSADVKDGGNKDQMMAAAKKDIDRDLGVLNEALKGRDYLLGEYSLADTHLYTFLRWMGFMGVTLEKYKNVDDWKSRVEERPALKQG